MHFCRLARTRIDYVSSLASITNQLRSGTEMRTMNTCIQGVYARDRHFTGTSEPFYLSDEY